jgi:hypothetical protein
MTTDLFANVSDEDLWQLEVDAVLIVDETLNLRPFEGHLDDGYEYDHTDER